MKKYFNVVYSLRGQEKEVSLSNIPEHISIDEIKLNAYLTEEIAKKEDAKKEDVSISSASCVFKFE